MSRLREAFRLKRPELWTITILGFFITIIYKLTFTSFFVTISPKNLTQLSVTTVWPVAIPKTQETFPGNAFRIDWWDKEIEDGGADGYSEKGLFGMFRGLVGGHVLSAVISVFVSPYMSIKTQHLLQGSNLNWSLFFKAIFNTYAFTFN